MKTLQTMRGRLSSVALINILVLGFVLIESRTSEIQLRHNSPTLQISNYFTPKPLTPVVPTWTLCACIQGGAQQA